MEQFDARTKQLLFQIKQVKSYIKDQARPQLDKLQENIDFQRVEIQKKVDLLHTLQSKQETNKEINEQIKLNKTKQTTLQDEYNIVGDLADLAHGNNKLRISVERYVLATFLDELLSQAHITFTTM